MPATEEPNTTAITTVQPASGLFALEKWRPRCLFARLLLQLHDSVGWSDRIQFHTSPVGGSDELKFLAFGDMGKAPRDSSVEHYIQPGSLSVIEAVTDEINSGNVDSVFHIGDISYATGFLVEWDFFLHQINPIASRVSYMTAIGNHERDYIDSGSVYILADSGGEVGVPYETYFPMPTPAKDKPWYSIEQGSVHITMISTEHDWTKNSEQYQWMKKDMASVDRSKTPWLIFMGHRPMYTSAPGFLSVDEKLLTKLNHYFWQAKLIWRCLVMSITTSEPAPFIRANA